MSLADEARELVQAKIEQDVRQELEDRKNGAAAGRKALPDIYTCIKQAATNGYRCYEHTIARCVERDLLPYGDACLEQVSHVLVAEGFDVSPKCTSGHNPGNTAWFHHFLRISW